MGLLAFNIPEGVHGEKQHLKVEILQAYAVSQEVSLFTRADTERMHPESVERTNAKKPNKLDNEELEELDNDNEGDPENPMITVMSLPDGARNRPEDKENEPDNVSIVQRESSFTAEYHYDEAEQEPNSPSPCPTPDYTFAIPKLEPIEVDDQLQHMSTPIVPPAKRLRGIKRSSPTIMQIGNVKIQKLSTTPSGNSHHYTVMRNDQEKVKSTVNCTKIERLNVSTTDTQLIANNSSMMKPHNFTACSCKADADTMFMQSLLPDIKKLRSEERMAFKVKVHQMLQDALYKSN